MNRASGELIFFTVFPRVRTSAFPLSLSGILLGDLWFVPSGSKGRGGYI